MTVTADIEPHHAHLGDVMSASATYTNCGRSIYVEYDFILTGPCGPVQHTRLHRLFLPNESLGLDTAPFDACLGTFRLVAKAYQYGQLLDRKTRRVHVRS